MTALSSEELGKGQSPGRGKGKAVDIAGVEETSPRGVRKKNSNIQIKTGMRKTPAGRERNPRRSLPLYGCKRKRIQAGPADDSLTIGRQWPAVNRRLCSRLDWRINRPFCERAAIGLASDKTVWHALQGRDMAKMTATRHKGESFIYIYIYISPARHRRRNWQGETADTKRVLSRPGTCW